MRLRREFENNRTQLLGHPTPPSLDEGLASLIAEEIHIRSLAPSATQMNHTSILAFHQSHFRGFPQIFLLSL
jgi:hypothetical protein